MSISSLILLLLIMFDRFVRVWCCPKEQSRETDRLWSLRSIDRISGFCRVSHRLYVTESPKPNALFCVLGFALAAFQMGIVRKSGGSRAQGLKDLGSCGVGRRPFGADSPALPHPIIFLV
ncbi:hypothetical protein GYMC52_0352 [Geobacillus sp. Y412MC52]|nr:hypothetical protein GYMC52_0352 [Geobacillus sp. Y412MC52]